MRENVSASISNPAKNAIDDLVNISWGDDKQSAEERQILADAIWSIALSFAQLGWGTTPVDQAMRPKSKEDDAY